MEGQGGKWFSCKKSVNYPISQEVKMELGQIIEYNIGNIFLEKSYTKCSGEASPTYS